MGTTTADRRAAGCGVVIQGKAAHRLTLVGCSEGLYVSATPSTQTRRIAFTCFIALAGCGTGEDSDGVNPETPPPQARVADPVASATTPPATPSANDTTHLPPPPLIGDSPVDKALLMRLTTHGIATTDIVHVATIEALIDSAAPGRTLVMAPGTYTIPEEGLGKLASSPGLSLVGTGLTRLIEPNFSRAVFTLHNTDDVTLFGLTLGHEHGACAGGVLDVAYSKGVRVMQCQLFGCGYYGLDLVHADDFSMLDSRVFDCSGGLAQVTDSKGVRWERSKIEDNGPELSWGLRIRRAQLALVDVEIRNNGADPGRALFEFDVDAIASQLGARPDPRPIATDVTMRGGTIQGNDFAELTDDPIHLTLHDVELAPGQFETAGYANAPRFWCTCARTLAPPHSPITSCFDAEDACTDRVRALNRSELGGLLASSLLHDCEPAYGTTPALALQDEGTWEQRDKAWHREGICLPEPPTTVTTKSSYVHAVPSVGTAPTTPRSLAGLVPAVEWESLLPLLDATIAKSGHPTVLVDIQSKDVYGKIYDDDTESMRWHPVTERGTPKEIRKLRSPFVVSTKGSARLKSARAWMLADQGTEAYWQIKYEGPAVIGPLVGSTGAPHPNARIQGLKPTTLSETVRDQVLREIARLVGRRWQAPLLTSLPGPSPVLVTVLAGASVGGATHWVSVTVNPPEDESGWGVVVTVDAHGHIVQTVTQPVGYMVELKYRTDLDGDGVDEIVCTGGAWEHSAEMVLHVTETQVSVVELSSGGS